VDRRDRYRRQAPDLLVAGVTALTCHFARCAAAIILLLVPSALNAVTCDATIRSVADGPKPYAPRGNGSYCEGTFARNIGASFEVLSVTLGTIAYAPGDPRLYISAPLSGSDADLDIRARGRLGT
jgi:hypothetical protein